MEIEESELKLDPGFANRFDSEDRRPFEEQLLRPGGRGHLGRDISDIDPDGGIWVKSPNL